MYQRFAQVYDALMEDVDYEMWAEYLEKVFHYYKIKPKTIIDLACGTGNITIPLAQKGYDMIGLDLSSDMLAVADQKGKDLSLSIQWINQNMKEIRGFREMDSVICACDGMNYILEEEELKDVFSKVYHSLKENGIFTFDMNSKYKLSTLFSDKTFAYSGEKISYIWENFYDPEKEIIDFELSFFIKRGKTYERFDEAHSQRAYSQETIEKGLKEAGFQLINSFEAFTFKKPSDFCERIQYIAIK